MIDFAAARKRLLAIQFHEIELGPDDLVQRQPTKIRDLVRDCVEEFGARAVAQELGL